MIALVKIFRNKQKHFKTGKNTGKVFNTGKKGQVDPNTVSVATVTTVLKWRLFRYSKLYTRKFTHWTRSSTLMSAKQAIVLQLLRLTPQIKSSAVLMMCFDEIWKKNNVIFNAFINSFIAVSNLWYSLSAINAGYWSFHKCLYNRESCFWRWSLPQSTCTDDQTRSEVSAKSLRIQFRKHSERCWNFQFLCAPSRRVGVF